MSSFINCLLILSIILVSLFISLVFFTLLICTTMLVFALFYSLIKRVCLWFRITRKLKKAAKSAMHQLHSGEKKLKKQNLACDTSMSPSAFKDSLVLRAKDYKIIFCLSFIMVLLLIGFMAVNATIQGNLGFVAEKWRLVTVIFFFVSMGCWGIMMALFPVFLILHGLFSCLLKRVMKKLKILDVQQGTPIIPQI